MVKINNKEVSPIGFGLMGFTWRPNPTPYPAAHTTLTAALNSHATFWNGGEFYGPLTANSTHLLASYFCKHPDKASQVVLSIKGACDPTTIKPMGSPAAVRRSLDTILRNLDGRVFVDIFEPARRDPDHDFLETLATIQEYVDAGKIGGIGLSEVSAATIDLAASKYTISAVELELSLWTLDILHNGVLAACKRHGIPIVAYSPLGYGAFTGAWKSRADIPAGHPVLHRPRFSEENFANNVKLVEKIEGLAQRIGLTAAQVAIRWVLGVGKREGVEIVVIPGATTVERVQENCGGRDLTEDEMVEIDGYLKEFEVIGERYSAGIPTHT